MTEFLVEQFTSLSDGLKYIMTFLISMLPIVELRGAVPVGTALGLDPFFVLFLSIIGNILPIPFIIMFSKRIIKWLKGTRLFSPLALKLEKKAEKNMDKITKYEKLGLFIFVAVPLPGTGAWTGALIASLLDMRIKNSVPPICFGVVGAGILMTLGSQAVKWLISFF